MKQKQKCAERSFHKQTIFLIKKKVDTYFLLLVLPLFKLHTHYIHNIHYIPIIYYIPIREREKWCPELVQPICDHKNKSHPRVGGWETRSSLGPQSLPWPAMLAPDCLALDFWSHENERLYLVWPLWCFLTSS